MARRSHEKKKKHSSAPVSHSHPRPTPWCFCNNPRSRFPGFHPAPPHPADAEDVLAKGGDLEVAHRVKLVEALANEVANVEVELLLLARALARDDLEDGLEDARRAHNLVVVELLHLAVDGDGLQAVRQRLLRGKGGGTTG